jgi:hypothetical protein
VVETSLLHLSSLPIVVTKGSLHPFSIPPI